MTTTCTDCEALLDSVPPDYACPSCGGMHRSVTIQVPAASMHLTAGRIGVTMTQGAWGKNWPLLLVVATLTLVSPFLGLVLAGWWGVWTGLALNVLTAILGFYAITRIFTITRS